MVSAASLCAHCRLSLPAKPHREATSDGDLLFCCVGCVLVYRVIGSAGEGGRADWYLAKLGLAALLSGNVMMFQALFYFWPAAELGPEVLRNGSWIMFGCSLAVYALLGVPMLRVACRSALRGRSSLETLIGLGALAAIGFSAVQTLRGGNQFYYDSGTMVLVFVSLGQYLDAEWRRKALAALSPAIDRARRAARVIRGDTTLTVPPDEVHPGERILVHGGEEIPVDGVVIEGAADVHEPMLTGEWRPRRVAAGDSVSAGSTAVDGALTLHATGNCETLAERVARWTLEARLRKAPIEALVDRVVSVFIPAVALVAIASLLLWGLSGSWTRGMLAAFSVLVVACPCALGIATPLATTIALWRAATRGALVRSGAALEALARVDTVAFDKTGTLTVGRPQVRRFRASDAELVAWTLLCAGAVESRTSHPFARPIVEFVCAEGCELPAATDVRITAGGGAVGEVAHHVVAVGNPTWLTGLGVASVAPKSEEDSGGSVVAVAINGCFAGEFILDDAPRPEAVVALQELAAMGVSCHLLSGDRLSAVAELATQIGCTSYAAQLQPDEKPARIAELRRKRAGVAMVGDGVNDAPALAAADVGIAFGAAADFARDNADVVMQREDLREIPRLLLLARRTFRIVRQNLSWAFGYNSIGIMVAAFGLLRPVVAAAAMVLSSLFVVANSMRLQRGGD